MDVDHPDEYEYIDHEAEYEDISHDEKYEDVQHDAEYEDIQHAEEGHMEAVVTKEAWDEPEIVDTFVRYCRGCGCEMQGWTEDEIDKHGFAHALAGENDSWYTTWEPRPTGNVIHHDAVTEDRWVVDKEAWVEHKLVKAAWTERVLAKPAYTEHKLVKEAWTESKLVKAAWTEHLLVKPAYTEQVLVTPGHYE